MRATDVSRQRSPWLLALREGWPILVSPPLIGVTYDRPVSVDIRVERGDGVWSATVRVDQRGARTEHRVTVKDDDLTRYGSSDAEDLVRRSFEFLLAREPSTSILREFRITEIERYFPEFPAEIRRI